MLFSRYPSVSLPVDKTFYYYYLPDYAKGDTLTIKTTDGNETYAYDAEEEAFVGKSDSIPVREITRKSNQEEENWKPGDNTFTLKYRGHSCNVKVTIVESPIVSAEIIPKEPYKFKQNDTKYGYIDFDYDENDYFYYEVPELKDGDKLIAITKDGDKVECTYSVEAKGFVSNQGITIVRDEDLEWETNQYRDPWLPNKENYITYNVLGKEVKVPVTIIASTPAAKKANTMKVATKKLTAKAKTLKKKKVTYKANKLFTVKNPKGTVTYKITKKASKAKNKIVIAKNGKITLKKGLKKGTYKFNVKVTAAGNASYKALSKTVTATVKVK